MKIDQNTKGLFGSRSIFKSYSLYLLVLCLNSCATYQSKVGEARNLMTLGQFEQASEKLKPLAEEVNGDQLAYLLDYATSLQMAGKYKESIDAFLKADQLSEQVDYHSISRIAGATLFNEEMIQYKGDSFEKIFISVQLALNYICLNKLEDALVEARRINAKISKLNEEGKANFEKNSFGKYLSALIWEADRRWDDAYLAYKEAYEIDPNILTIGRDLVRSSTIAKRREENKEWKEKFSDIKEENGWTDKGLGELIVIVQQGWGPRKRPDPGSRIMPMLEPVYSDVNRVELNIPDIGSFESLPIYYVGRAAISSLAADRAALIGRRIGSRVAKEVVADQIRQKNEALGFITWLGLILSERADLRQWSTLPDTIQIIRVPLKPGKHKYRLQGKSYNGLVSSGERDAEVLIEEGKKSFIIYRVL